MKLHLRVVDRYIISELVGPFIIGIFGFIMVMITDLLFSYTDLIINRGVPFGAVLKLLLFKLPYILVMTFPVALLFATAMALGRLSRDNEVVALRTSGVSFFRICLPIVVFSLIISTVSFFINEKLVPYANHRSDDIIQRIIYKKPVPRVKENVFFKDSHNRYYYVKEIDVKTDVLRNVLIYEFATDDKIPRVIVANEANFENLIWDLRHGKVHKFDDNGQLEYESTFENMKIYVNEDLVNFTNQKSGEEMNIQELRAEIETLGKSGKEVHSLETDYYMKFSAPLTCFIFALVAIPLSLPTMRSGKTWGVTLSVVLMFTFYVFFSVFRSLGRGGVLPPLVAAWGPQFCFGTFGLVLLLREGFKK